MPHDGILCIIRNDIYDITGGIADTISLCPVHLDIVIYLRILKSSGKEKCVCALSGHQYVVALEFVKLLIVSYKDITCIPGSCLEKGIIADSGGNGILHSLHAFCRHLIVREFVQIARCGRQGHDCEYYNALFHSFRISRLHRVNRICTWDSCYCKYLQEDWNPCCRQYQLPDQRPRTL